MQWTQLDRYSFAFPWKNQFNLVSVAHAAQVHVHIVKAVDLNPLCRCYKMSGMVMEFCQILLTMHTSTILHKVSLWYAFLKCFWIDSNKVCLLWNICNKNNLFQGRLWHFLHRRTYFYDHIFHSWCVTSLLWYTIHPLPTGMELNCLFISYPLFSKLLPFITNNEWQMSSTSVRGCTAAMTFVLCLLQTPCSLAVHPLFTTSTIRSPEFKEFSYFSNAFACNWKIMCGFFWFLLLFYTRAYWTNYWSCE